MSTQDVERRIVDVLRARAEDAMRATHVEEDLDLLRRRARRDRRWRRALGSAALLAAVAASTALLLPKHDLADSGGGPAPSDGTGPGSVAVEVLAGDLHEAGAADGKGADARFSYLSGIAVAPNGTVYVTDADSFPGAMGGPAPGSRTRIRAITPDGTVTTLVDRPFKQGRGSNAFESLAVDGSGQVFVQDLDAIDRVSPDGQVEPVVGDPNRQEGPCAPLAPVLENACAILGLAADSSGALYVGAGREVGTVSPDGKVTRLAGCPACADGIWGVAVDDSFRVYFTADGQVRTISPNGEVTTLRLQLGPNGVGEWKFLGLRGLAVRPDGSAIYVTDLVDNTIVLNRVTPDGVVTRIDHPLINGAIVPKTASANSGDVAVGPDGAVYLIKDGTAILKVTGA